MKAAFLVIFIVASAVPVFALYVMKTNDNKPGYKADTESSDTLVKGVSPSYKDMPVSKIDSLLKAPNTSGMTTYDRNKLILDDLPESKFDSLKQMYGIGKNKPEIIIGNQFRAKPIPPAPPGGPKAEFIPLTFPDLKAMFIPVYLPNYRKAD